VRSSACGEDGEDRSFAGEFRTLLGVERSGVRQAIAAVRASYQGRSGGVVVQVPVTQPVTVSPLLRIDGCGRLPAINVAAGRPGQRGAALPQSGRGASIRACHLGTPPPHSLSSRAGCPARPIQA